MPPESNILSESRPVFDGVSATTGEWIAALVQRALGDKAGAKLTSLKAKRLDEEQGYTSIVAKLSLEWSSSVPGSRSCTNLPSSVILKMPVMGKFEEIMNGSQENSHEQWDPTATFELLKANHNTECRMHGVNGGTNSSVLFPRVLESKDLVNSANLDAYILMEDLSGRGRSPDIVDGMTIEQCKAVINNVASLHAYCLRNAEWNAAGFIRPAEKKEFEVIDKFFKPMISALLDFAPALLSEIGISLEEFWEIIDMQKAAEELCAHDSSVPIHGDLWCNNLLFGAAMPDDSLLPNRYTTDELVAIIDWQTSRIGMCAADLARMMISCLDTKLRRDNEQLLLEYYYTSLMDKIPVSNTIPFTLADVKQMYFKNCFRMYAAILCIHGSLLFGQKKCAKEKYSEEQIRNFVKRIQAGILDARMHCNSQ